MADKHSIMLFGASYGSLLATKLAMAGHDATLVCLPEEADLIEREGTRVRMPIRGREAPVRIDSRNLPGRVGATTTDAADPARFDLAVLAMQEPQYAADGPRRLLAAVAAARLPCLSIMNMPPMPYLSRLPGVDAAAFAGCYTDPTVWAPLDPALVTLCSPDPQAFRPPGEPANLLQVTLPTNFKAARFEDDGHTAMLRRLQADIEAARLEVDGAPVEVPVKLKVHDSVFVPLAKWCMLMAGNYRCVQADGMRPIREAVNGDPAASRAVYDWVAALCRDLGAAEADLVPFEKYAAAAENLAKPSSAARALDAGAPRIERLDRLVQQLADERGRRCDAVDTIVALVDGYLEKNRAA